MLLSTTDTPIGTIGAGIGWPHPSQFSRRFRQHMGVSPRAYRTQSRRHHAARHGRTTDPGAEAAGMGGPDPTPGGRNAGA